MHHVFSRHHGEGETPPGAKKKLWTKIVAGATVVACGVTAAVVGMGGTAKAKQVKNDRYQHATGIMVNDPNKGPIYWATYRAPDGKTRWACMDIGLNPPSGGKDISKTEIVKRNVGGAYIINKYVNTSNPIDAAAVMYYVRKTLGSTKEIKYYENSFKKRDATNFNKMVKRSKQMEEEAKWNAGPYTFRPSSITIARDKKNPKLAKVTFPALTGNMGRPLAKHKYTASVTSGNATWQSSHAAKSNFVSDKRTHDMYLNVSDPNKPISVRLDTQAPDYVFRLYHPKKKGTQRMAAAAAVPMKKYNISRKDTPQPPPPGVAQLSTVMKAQPSGDSVSFNDEVTWNKVPAGNHGSAQNSLYVFGKGTELSQANLAKATKVCTVNVPVKNGTQKVTDAKCKVDDAKKHAGDIAVWQTTYKGDKQIKPITSSLTDTAEQWTFPTPPPPAGSLSTMMKSTVDGDKATLTDDVTFTIPDDKDHGKAKNSLYIFDKNTAISQGNLPKAKKVCTVDVPVKKGVQKAAGPDCTANIKDNYDATAVWQTTFSGDDVVKAMTSDLGDTAEQWKFPPKPNPEGDVSTMMKADVDGSSVKFSDKVDFTIPDDKEHGKAKNTLWEFERDADLSSTDHAKKVCTVDVPVKNGSQTVTGDDCRLDNMFSHSKNRLVWQTTYPGDDVVKKMTSDLADENEQWTVPTPPSVKGHLSTLTRATVVDGTSVEFGDDVTWRGLPEGDHGTARNTLYLFDKGTKVSQANAAKATKICSVDVPVKNGTHRVSDPKCRLDDMYDHSGAVTAWQTVYDGEQGEDGDSPSPSPSLSPMASPLTGGSASPLFKPTARPTSARGVGAVEPMTSDLTDTAEQWRIPDRPKPAITTKALVADKHVSEVRVGMKIADEVKYTNFIKGDHGYVDLWFSDKSKTCEGGDKVTTFDLGELKGSGTVVSDAYTVGKRGNYCFAEHSADKNGKELTHATVGADAAENISTSGSSLGTTAAIVSGDGTVGSQIQDTFHHAGLADSDVTTIDLFHSAHRKDCSDADKPIASWKLDHLGKDGDTVTEKYTTRDRGHYCYAETTRDLAGKLVHRADKGVAEETVHIPPVLGTTAAIIDGDGRVGSTIEDTFHHKGLVGTDTTRVDLFHSDSINDKTCAKADKPLASWTLKDLGKDGDTKVGKHRTDKAGTYCYAETAFDKNGREIHKDLKGVPAETLIIKPHGGAQGGGEQAGASTGDPVKRNTTGHIVAGATLLVLAAGATVVLVRRKKD
ncbi:MAG: hypothetical protein R5N75_08455 [Cutibacterium granulosum]|uniref:hypothetical protein n=1 Tax=Cutibacterium granulosum TaxID=33011 RepID=UPI002B228024|nr:hypothetical protein [Cutibacterium granulosum]MEA5660121.1 hypothetical protein [Cutibacterium granulosum]